MYPLAHPLLGRHQLGYAELDFAFLTVKLTHLQENTEWSASCAKQTGLTVSTTNTQVMCIYTNRKFALVSVNSIYTSPSMQAWLARTLVYV